MLAIKRVGIVGLGAMGRPMGRHLISKGFSVTGYDPISSARELASTLGIRVAGSPREVAEQSDLVLIVVGFESQVEAAIFGEAGIQKAARKDLIVAMGSTVSPSFARRISDRLNNSGIILLDMALTRGEPAAEEGTMLILGGGNEEYFDACRPAFACFGSEIFNLGPFGSGQVGKMVNNLVLWACTAINDEGLRLGEALGVDQESLRTALNSSSAQNWSMSTRADERPTPWAEKDMNIVLQEADSARLSLPLSGCVKEVIKGFKLQRGYPTPFVE